MPVYSLLLVCVLSLQVHTRPRVQRAPGIPHALKGGETTMHNSGTSRREIAKPYLMCTNAPHSQPSSPAKAGDPVFRDAGDRTERLRRTGYSAFAEYDGSLW